MVQQIEFIIYTNIQPLQQKFFAKGQCHRSWSMSKIKKNFFLLTITWKIIIATPIFYVKLLMSSWRLNIFLLQFTVVLTYSYVSAPPANSFSPKVKVISQCQRVKKMFC